MTLIFLILPKVLLPADASDFILQSALNDLWSIKPDTVQVIRTQNPQSYVYLVTFVSTRGKHVFRFALLYSFPRKQICILSNPPEKGKSSTK